MSEYFTEAELYEARRKSRTRIERAVSLAETAQYRFAKSGLLDLKASREKRQRLAIERLVVNASIYFDTGYWVEMSAIAFQVNQ